MKKYYSLAFSFLMAVTILAMSPFAAMAQGAPPSVTITAPQTNATLTVNAQATISWNTTGSGFDKYQIVVGNSLTNTERQLYDKVSVVDYIPAYQTNFFWNIPDLLSDFAKGSSYSFDQIKNSFYLQVKLMKSDNAGGSYVASSNKIAFSVQAAASVAPSVVVTSPQSNSVLATGSITTIAWNTTGSGFDKYEIVVGNSVTNSERQLYDRVSMVDYIPSYQKNFTWSIPDLLTDFAKGSSYSFDQIKNSFYLQVKLIKNDSVSGSYITSSNKVLFSISYNQVQSPTIVSPQAPTISYISPNGATRGDTVYVYGSNFDQYTFAYLDGTSSPTLTTTYISPTSLSFIVPANMIDGSYKLFVNEKASNFPQGNSVSLSIVSANPQINTNPQISSSGTSKTIQSLLDKVQALQNQISQMQSSQSVSPSNQSDNAPSGTTGNSCLILSSDLGYRSRDASTNGNVSALQDFLQVKGFLSSEPTGFFGLLTTKAVQGFQSSNSINPTGYVGPLTRAKIQQVSCVGQ